MTQHNRISLAGVAEAARLIDPLFRNTPQVEYEPLSNALGARVVVKVETINPIRCFKGRGADNYVRLRPDRTALVLASAGNFGQGVAYSARQRGIPLVVFAATNANPMKLARMRDLGAEVVLRGHDFDAAKQAAREHAEATQTEFIEDGRDAPITEGAGTIAVELLSGSNRFDTVLVALGNGALVNGVGLWTKAQAPGTRVVAVCASGAPSMERSWRSGRVETTDSADTIADGIAVRVPVPKALEDMRETVDDILLVEDAHILTAMRLLLEHTGLVIEPSGAVGVAAMLANPRMFAGQSVATILCGGNVTGQQMREWLLGHD